VGTAPPGDARLRVRVLSPYGLHLRPAGQISLALKGCPCTVRARFGNKTANAKSAAELVMLEAPEGAEIMLQFDGDGALEHSGALSSAVTSQDLEFG